MKKGGVEYDLWRKVENGKKVKRTYATGINVKHNSVSDWENDKYKPDIDSVQLLIDVLDIEPSYIMGTKTTEEYGSLIGEIMNEPFLLDMIEDYKRLSELDKKAIRQIISSLRNGME